jgi:hypothetical protein
MLSPVITGTPEIDGSPGEVQRRGHAVRVACFKRRSITDVAGGVYEDSFQAEGGGLIRGNSGNGCPFRCLTRLVLTVRQFY